MRQLPAIEPAAWLTEYLDAAEEFDVEHHGLLTNHLTHGLIALGSTGASRDDADVFWRRYLGELDEPHPRHAGGPEPALEATDLQIGADNWHEFINDKRRHHGDLRRFFRNELDREGVSRVVATNLPPLVPGLAGGALHPLIHCGLAIEAANSAMLADGLAYMATMQQRLGVGSGPDSPSTWRAGEPNLVEATLTALTAARDSGLPQISFDAALTAEYLRTGRGLFQQRIMAFNDDALPLGRWLDALEPPTQPGLGEDLTPAIEQAVLVAAAAFRASSCEFFVLHALTSLHSLLVVMPMLAEDDRRVALAHWWRAAVATMVSQDAPGLEDLENLIGERHESNVDWVELHLAARPSHDEHVQKAVFSLWRWASSGMFTPSTVDLCAAAAKHAVRATPSGRVHDNVWFAWSGVGPPGEQSGVGPPGEQSGEGPPEEQSGEGPPEEQSGEGPPI